jgi:organic radical activating enzyme
MEAIMKIQIGQNLIDFMRGKDKPLIIPYVEHSITTCCTLRCKDCGLFNAQYYFHKEKTAQNFDFTLIKKDMDNFLSAVDEVSIYRLIGGEPFLHPQWDILLKHLYKYKKIKTVEFITNGTVLPDRSVNVLQNPKLEIIISNYGDLSAKMNELISLLKSKKIKYRIANCIKNNWWNAGDNRDRNRNKNDLIEVFKSCHLAKKCKHILNGKLFVCSRDAHAQNLGIFPNDNNSYIELSTHDYTPPPREIY